jgi:transposase
MSHPQYPGRPKTARSLTEKDEIFIKENYEEMPVSKMAKRFNVSARTVYRFMSEQGLKTYDVTREVKRKKKGDVPDGCFDWKLFDNCVI